VNMRMDQVLMRWILAILSWKIVVRERTIRGAVLVLLLSAFASSAAAQTFRLVTEAMLEDPDPAEWLHMSRTYDQQRHSPLEQINTTNVGQLRMAWSRGLPVGAQESTPLVHDGVMYVIAPGDGVLALDATNGDLIWEHWGEHTPDARARSKSLGIYQDLIFHSAADGFIRALDARTGAVRWETKTVEDGFRNSAGGVLVADGKVLTNRSCNRYDDRRLETTGRKGCFIAAHDAMTGNETWKFFTTAGADDPGGDTWGITTSEERVASPWGLPGSYDPSRKTTYWGVANPDPYTRLTRHGAPDAISNTAPSNLYSNSTVALNIETGELVWHYQELPGDSWDADHNHERVLVRTRVRPDPSHVKWISPTAATETERDIVVTVAEGGGMFAVNRDDGRFLWSRPFPYDTPDLNMNHIDVTTGATQANYDKVFKQDGETVLECYHNTRSLWNIAYHPEKNSLYVPFHDQCLSMTANLAAPSGYGRRVGVMRPGINPDTFMGIAKIDLSTGEMRVIYSQPQPTNGSALTTAGDLVFFGDLNRRLRAIDAEDGTLLWETIVGGMVVNSTITYAVNGKQYVMVFTGEGRSATSGPLRVAADSMPEPVRGHNSIYVFALP
jgi:alcohol dehydrogenase (cytochrome c)